MVRFVANLYVQYVNNKSNQWSLSLTVHVLSVCVAKCFQISTDACYLVITVAVPLCVQRDIVYWA